MNFKYVVVFGCSYSTDKYPNGAIKGETYGDIIAKHFGAECINLAQSGTGIQFLHRKFFEWSSENKHKLKDSLIILGVPPFERLEMWSNISKDYFKMGIQKWDSDEYAPKTSFYYKIFNAWPLEERKNYFKNFYDSNQIFIQSTNLLVGLQSFLNLNKVNHIFFDSIWSIHDNDEGYGRYKKPAYWPDIKFNKQHYNHLISKDNWYPLVMQTWLSKDKTLWIGNDQHPNSKAHKLWANKLLTFLESK